jgi:hypothetical protein
MTTPKFLRFYFHIVGDGRDHKDDTGEVFASVQAAEAHAKRIAHDLRYDAYQACTISVTDAEGAEVARVPIGALKS